MSEDKSKKDNFVEVEDDELPDIVDFNDVKEVTGNIKGFKTIKLERKNVEVAIFTDADRVFGVWVSTGLDKLHDFRPGTRINIRTTGLEKCKDGVRYWRKYKIKFDPSTGGFKPKKDD